MFGVTQNLRRLPRWIWHLLRGNIERYQEAPSSPIPMRAVQGGKAAHGLPHQTIAGVEETEEEKVLVQS